MGTTRLYWRLMALWGVKSNAEADISRRSLEKLKSPHYTRALLYRFYIIDSLSDTELN